MLLPPELHSVSSIRLFLGTPVFRRKVRPPALQGELLFREVQRFRDTWLWPALLTPAVLASAFVIYVGIEVAFLDDDGIVARDAVALAICFYILKGFGVLIVALYAARLEVEVRSDGLYWRMAPFQMKHRHVSREQLQTAQIRSSARQWRRGWRVYGVKGRDAVEVVIPNGQRLLIGTQQPGELAAALLAGWSPGR
jgi:hypothetical protein